MSENPFNLTSLTYDDIVNQVRDLLSSDPRFNNFRDSAVFSTVVQIFAGSTDLLNFYLEQRARESFLDTAQLKSSAILLSQMIGYVPSRKEPAQTAINIEIAGPLPMGLAAGDIVYFPKRTSFSFNGNPYILKYTYKYTFTQSDIDNGVGNPDYLKSITGALYSSSYNYDLITSATSVSASDVIDIELIQGSIESFTIEGIESQQINQIFQKYKISDTSFSNLYGENDLGYDPETGSQDQSQNLTRIAISDEDPFAQEAAGTLINYDDFYDIDRRTLLNPASPLTETFTSAVPICLVKSYLNEQIEIIFGDNLFAKKGLVSVNDNIYIQYLSTLGTAANKIGVIGQVISSDDTFEVNSIDLTSNITFKLSKNITGGADFENIESMKINAPGNFASFGRCVTAKDYISYLKSLTSPIVIKNAIAWGEQEESEFSSPIEKLFNIVLFSALASLYDKSGDIYTAKMINGSTASNNLSAAVLDDNYSPYTLLPSSYFNILIKESVANELNVVTNLPSSSKVLNVTNKLNTRSQITVKNIYITPIIQEMQLVGNVYIKNFSDINLISKNINNSIYEYLDLNADFNSPVYLSNVVQIIENHPNVIYSNVGFMYFPTSGVTFDYNATSGTVIDNDIADWIPVGNETSATIVNVITSNIDSYIESRTNYSFSELIELYDSFIVKSDTKTQKIDINERNFYNELIKDMYEDLLALAGGAFAADSFANSQNFQNVIVKIHNSFERIIKTNLLSQEGDIDLFSIRNEIAKISLNQVYLYR